MSLEKWNRFAECFESDLRINDGFDSDSTEYFRFLSGVDWVGCMFTGSLHCLGSIVNC